LEGSAKDDLMMGKCGVSKQSPRGNDFGMVTTPTDVCLPVASLSDCFGFHQRAQHCHLRLLQGHDDHQLAG
jgi:hypothetical protein